MADMMRPCGKPDAILGHVALWGDRSPMDASTSKQGYFVNRGESGGADDRARHVATVSIGGQTGCGIVERDMDKNT
jgi:hypothetical protein